VSFLGQRWKLLTLTSIIIAVSLLVSFRLAGVFKETETKVEEITLEPETLTLLQPSETLENINKSARNKWTQEGVSITLDIDILSYRKGAALAPFYGHDGLTFKTYVSAVSREGYFSSILISFHPFDNSSIVFLDTNPWSLEVLNGSILGMIYFGTNETDAYIETNVLDSSCSIRDQLFWVLLDEHNESHELQITSEVMHVNETATKKITIPIVLKMTLSWGELSMKKFWFPILIASFVFSRQSISPLHMKWKNLQTLLRILEREKKTKVLMIHEMV